MSTPHERSSVRRAEILSAVGAGFLGAGLALVLQNWLRGLAMPFLLGGIAVHAFGMGLRHRIETRKGVQRASWEGVLYWSCWVGLFVLAAWPLLRG